MDIFWTKEEGPSIKIGFTKDFLKSGELWHIYPVKYKVSKGKPFLVIESTEEQLSIDSPLSGKITYFNDKAVSFPCLLEETDVIAILSNEVTDSAPIKRSPRPHEVIAVGDNGLNQHEIPAEARDRVMRDIEEYMNNLHRLRQVIPPPVPRPIAVDEVVRDDEIGF